MPIRSPYGSLLVFPEDCECPRRVVHHVDVIGIPSVVARMSRPLAHNNSRWSEEFAAIFEQLLYEELDSGGGLALSDVRLG